MSCDALARWLDDGAPAEGEAAFLAHASECPACAGALEAARAIEKLLGVAPAAPGGFADRVMARVASAERARHAAPRPALPWWARAAAEPAAALAFAAAALTLWGAERIARGVLALAVAAGGIELPWPQWSLGIDSWVALGVGVALLPLAIWASWQLFAWTERAALQGLPVGRPPVTH